MIVYSTMLTIMVSMVPSNLCDIRPTEPNREATQNPDKSNGFCVFKKQSWNWPILLLQQGLPHRCSETAMTEPEGKAPPSEQGLVVPTASTLL
jgi:hypothetical protein